MKYVDKLTKEFLTSNTWVTNPYSAVGNARVGVPRNRWGDYEDPTYMGFYFSINPYGNYDPTNQDYDVLPQGLFLPSNGDANGGAVTGMSSPMSNVPDSAENFLKRRGEYYRANMMSEFREGMLYVIGHEPWVFEKVSGVGDLWKADPKINWRAKDKKLVFDCHESISMKMTYLIDCYRKAAFDYNNMRYMLPDLQRYFSMDLYVTEIRDMKTASGGNFNTASFVRFRLDYCEFDFFTEDTTSYMSELSRYAPDKGAGVKMTIKVGAIREINNYGLLGGMIGDTVYTWQRGKEVAGEAFTQNTSIKDGGENQGSLVNDNSSRLAAIKAPFPQTSFSDPIKAKQNIGNNGFAANSAFAQFDAKGKRIGKGDFEGGTANIQGQNMGNVPTEATPSQNLDQTAPSNVNSGAPVPPSTLESGNLGSVDVGSRARSLAANLIRGAFLGNVYGLSLSTLAGQLQGVLNNPVAALQGLLSKFAKSPSEASSMAENVQLSGADAKLLNDFIGQVKEIQSITAGTELDNATLGELAQLPPPASSPINPAKQPLTSSSKQSLMGSPLGKILFAGSPIANAAAKKETLEGPDVKITDDIDPNSASLQAPDINSPKDLGNIGFPSGDSISRRVSG
jgi:hypothetical protein